MKSLVLAVLSLFVIAQILGFFSGLVLLLDMSTNPVVQQFPSVVEQDNPLNSVYFFLYTLIGAAVIIFFIRYLKSDLAFTLLEFTIISSASSIVFYSFSRLFLPYVESMMIGIVLGVALALLKILFSRFKNPAVVFSAAGAGALMGISLGAIPAFIFIVFLAVYDYIAVFKTKHMVELANYVIKKNLSFTITSKKYIPELKKEQRLDLGSGDLIAPVIVEVAVFQISPIASLFVFIGAFASLAIFLFYATKKRAIFPAMPPIAFGMILFFLIGKVIVGY